MLHLAIALWGILKLSHHGILSGQAHNIYHSYAFKFLQYLRTSYLNNVYDKSFPENTTLVIEANQPNWSNYFKLDSKPSEKMSLIVKKKKKIGSVKLTRVL